MTTEKAPPFLEQIRNLVKDSVDIVALQITLLQAKTVSYVLTAVVFILLLVIAVVLGGAGFVLFNISLGVWLKNVLQSTALSLVILGSAYALLGLLLGGYALRWLKKLKS